MSTLNKRKTDHTNLKDFVEMHIKITAFHLERFKEI